MHSHNVQLNIPFCAEMNGESIAILQVMICETKHEIQGGGNHPPCGSPCYKKSLVALGLKKKIGVQMTDLHSRISISLGVHCK